MSSFEPRRIRRYRGRRRRGDVELDLLIGPRLPRHHRDPDGPEAQWERQALLDELRPAWFELRPMLMNQCPAGSRPWGFWEYEHGEHPKDEAARLAELGVLTEAEAAHLKAWANLSKKETRE